MGKYFPKWKYHLFDDIFVAGFIEICLKWICRLLRFSQYTYHGDRCQNGHCLRLKYSSKWRYFRFREDRLHSIIRNKNTFSEIHTEILIGYVDIECHIYDKDDMKMASGSNAVWSTHEEKSCVSEKSDDDRDN